MWALKKLHEKNWRVSLCVQELFHPQEFSLNSCSHSGAGVSLSLDTVVVGEVDELEEDVG